MIDVKLNNRKTKKIGGEKDEKSKTTKLDKKHNNNISNKIKNNK